MLRIDPYWLEYIPQNARVLIYGGGDVGEQYIRQMERRKDLVCVSYMGFNIPTVYELKEKKYDILLIAVKNKEKAEQIKRQFVDLGVEKERIFWFEQQEVYWKYAEAEGLLDE